MKNLKITSIFCIVLLILLSSNVSFARTGIVNTPAARVREKASQDSEIVTRAYEDDEVEIVGEEGDWYKVNVEGKTGYISKNLIKEKKSSETTNTTSNTANTTNTTTPANTDTNTATNTPSNDTNTNTQNTTPSSKATIKEDASAKVMPNFASNEVALLTNGTEVEVLKELNNWVEVSVSGSKVWILKNKIDAGTSTPDEDNKPEENTNTNTNTSNDTNTTNTTNTTTNTATNTATNTSTTNTTNTTTTTTTSSATNKKGTINVETANIRQKADKSSNIIHRLDEGDEVTIVAEEGDWYKITNSEVESGYVSKPLVTVKDVTSRGDTEARIEPVPQETASVNKGSEVVDFAKQYLGYDYVLGGKTPETGFDCSGYTRYIYKNFGYSLGTVAADQTSVGTEITRSDLQEGDLILFYNEEKTKIGHTGVYIGNNEFIHAANPDRGIVIDNLDTNSYYSTRFVSARRIV